MQKKSICLNTIHDRSWTGFTVSGTSDQSLIPKMGKKLVKERRVRRCVYHEKTNRELNRIHIYECRCDERLRKTEGSTFFSFTGLLGELER